MNKNILLIVQNNSFPFDKRVYREAVSLKQDGNNIFVISPKSNHDQDDASEVEGIKVRRYKDYLAKGGIGDYIIEYFNALLRIHFLVGYFVLTKKIDVIHVANPPDLFWPLALLSKVLNIKFIYDQHDLAPEMSRSKFQSNIIYKMLMFNERLSAKLSDAIIVVNNTFKERLIDKWSIQRDKCHVVYNGPPEDFTPIDNQTLLEQYKDKKVVLYVGLMTVNDHIEIIVEAAKEIVINKGKTDTQFIIVGDGDVRSQMEDLVHAYKLDEYVDFTGIVSHKRVREYLNIAHVCIAPDLPNQLNEYLTLVKILEYMKCSKAFVAFKLKETIDFAGDAGLYAEDEIDFAEKILLLINNPDLEKEMGVRGNKIISENYLWTHSEKVLIELYNKF